MGRIENPANMTMESSIYKKNLFKEKAKSGVAKRRV